MFRGSTIAMDATSNGCRQISISVRARSNSDWLGRTIRAHRFSAADSNTPLTECHCQSAPRFNRENATCSASDERFASTYGRGRKPCLLARDASPYGEHRWLT